MSTDVNGNQAPAHGGHVQVRKTLREEILTVWRTWIPADVPAVLVDFPNHQNPGDSAIWLAQLSLLDSFRTAPLAVFDSKTYHAPTVRRLLGSDGVILIHGGGNFGDLYRERQRFRLRVLRDHPGRKVVQLPQTSHFTSEEAAKETVKTCRKSDFTLMARDRRTLAWADRELPGAGVFSHDAVFGWQPPPAPRLDPGQSVLIFRRDAESRTKEAQGRDWLRARDYRLPTRALRRLLATHIPRVYARWSFGTAGGPPGLDAVLAGAFRRFARLQVEKNLRLFGSADVVVTDRLHAHILALLQGRRSVLLDNSYGKNQAVFEATSYRFPGASMASHGGTWEPSR